MKKSRIELKIDYIQRLIDKKRYKCALRELYDYKTSRIKSIYCKNGNHVWYLTGIIFYDTKLYRLAKIAFSQAVYYNSDDWMALFALGNCCSSLRQNEMAIRCFGWAFDIRPSEDILFNIANAYFDLRNFEEAIEKYKKIKINRHLVDLARINMGLAQEKLRQRD